MSDNEQAGLGRTMIILAWILFFGFMFVFFYYYGQGKSGSFQVNKGIVTITPDSQGHYRLKGRINNYPVEFMLDTGATIVAVPQRVADKIQLEGRYPVTINTASGEVTGSLTRLNELVFADFTLKNIKAVIISGNEDETVLLGMNVLSQFNLSQQNNQLIIKK